MDPSCPKETPPGVQCHRSLARETSQNCFRSSMRIVDRDARRHCTPKKECGDEVFDAAINIQPLRGGPSRRESITRLQNRHLTERQADSLRYNSFHADSAALFGAANWRRRTTPRGSGEWADAPRSQHLRGFGSVVSATVRAFVRARGEHRPSANAQRLKCLKRA